MAENEVNESAGAAESSPAQGQAAAHGSAARTTAARGGALARFMRSAVPDFLLVWVLSVALDLTVSYAFNSGASLYGNPLLVGGVEFAVLVALFAGSWSKRALVPSGVAVGIMALVAIVAGLATSTESLVSGYGVVDVPGNNLIFCLWLVAVPAIVYALSRRPWGLVALVFADILACGVVQYLYRDWVSTAMGDIVTIVVLVATASLFVFQTYRQSLLRAQRASSPNFFGACALSVAISVLCVFVGCLVFYGVVAPMGLQTPKWKPFFEYRMQPDEYFDNPYDQQHVSSEQVKTDETNDNEEDSNKNAEDGNKGESDGSSSGAFTSFINGMTELVSGYDPDDPNSDRLAVAYNIVRWTLVIVATLAVLSVALAIFLRIRRRETRLKNLEKEPYPYRVYALYNFFLKRFGKMRAKKPAYLTPSEYAAASQRTLASFTEGAGGVSFVDVTRIYERVCIGGMPVTAEEYDQLKQYYRAFFKSARKRVGWPRWLFFKFWRI